MKKALPKIDGIIVHCAHTTITEIGKLKPYPRNNKTHPDAQVAMLAKIIKAQGWRAPGRWYWKDEPGADHFNKADQAEVEAAIIDGAKVQLVGYHGRSLALWATWDEFKRAVN